MLFIISACKLKEIANTQLNLLVTVKMFLQHLAKKPKHSYIPHQKCVVYVYILFYILFSLAQKPSKFK